MANMLVRIKQLKKVPDGSYIEFKLRFIYHNNKIAGSSFTLSQLVSMMMDDQIEGPMYLADMLASENSLKLFDFMIDTLGQKLSKEMLAEYYRILVKHQEVQADINVEESELYELLTWYNRLETVTLKDIAEFHYGFMRNRTFHDETGQIGRFIVLKQCLENGIVPFIIKEKDEEQYWKALELHIEDLMELFEKCNKYDI